MKSNTRWGYWEPYFFFKKKVVLLRINNGQLFLTTEGVKKWLMLKVSLMKMFWQSDTW
jgi:hypothetical protein